MLACSAQVDSTTLRPVAILNCTAFNSYLDEDTQQNGANQTGWSRAQRQFMVTARNLDLATRDPAPDGQSSLLKAMSNFAGAMTWIMYPWRIQTIGPVMSWLSVLY